jgi:hypothetical protein
MHAYYIHIQIEYIYILGQQNSRLEEGSDLGKLDRFKRNIWWTLEFLTSVLCLAMFSALWPWQYLARSLLNLWFPRTTREKFFIFKEPTEEFPFYTGANCVELFYKTSFKFALSFLIWVSSLFSLISSSFPLHPFLDGHSPSGPPISLSGLGKCAGLGMIALCGTWSE